MLRDGASFQEITQEYPRITDEDIRAGFRLFRLYHGSSLRRNN
ncbi:MAG: DUF433 domain-containing protein [Candidatus Lokiarchaeota archaeon]|nr:DUF433 domain-containing protein [Candidatus Lokiarchaeota archaeon]